MVKAGARSEWVRVMSLNGYSTVQFSVDNGRMTSAEAVNSVEIVSIQYYVEMLQFNCYYNVFSMTVTNNEITSIFSDF